MLCWTHWKVKQNFLNYSQIHILIQKRFIAEAKSWVLDKNNHEVISITEESKQRNKKSVFLQFYCRYFVLNIIRFNIGISDVTIYAWKLNLKSRKNFRRSWAAVGGGGWGLGYVGRMRGGGCRYVGVSLVWIAWSNSYGKKTFRIYLWPWNLPAVPNYYTLETNLLLKSNIRIRSESSKAEVSVRK